MASEPTEACNYKALNFNTFLGGAYLYTAQYCACLDMRTSVITWAVATSLKLLPPALGCEDWYNLKCVGLRDYPCMIVNSGNVVAI